MLVASLTQSDSVSEASPMNGKERRSSTSQVGKLHPPNVQFHLYVVIIWLGKSPTCTITCTRPDGEWEKAALR